MNSYYINNIINHIQNVKKGRRTKRGICFLIGAGADISSGGVPFRELKILFLQQNGIQIPSNISEKELDACFENQVDLLSQDGRCETLDKIMREHKNPSEGYLLMVLLAQLGYIDAIITTNFDYLLEETQEVLNLKPFTIYAPGKAIPDESVQKPRIISPTYLKMHGDLLHGIVTHLTTSEIKGKPYGDTFITLFREIIYNCTVVVVGYGGYDNLITDIFSSMINNLDDVYWCNTKEPNKDSQLVKILDENKKLYYVNISFDKLFEDLAKELLKNETLKNTTPIFLPTLVTSKIEHQNVLFEKRIMCKDRLVSRSVLRQGAEEFFRSRNNRCMFITGERKYGKSCFVYQEMKLINDITFLPIFPTPEYDGYHILKTMAHAVGYNTDVPFSVMYSFLKWLHKINKNIVFVIDDFFSQDCSIENNMSYIVEFFNFIYVSREFENIQFIICFQSDIYNQLEKFIDFMPFNKSSFNHLEVGEFLDDEVGILLNGLEITDDVDVMKKQTLLHIPYVWEIIHNNNIVPSAQTNTDFFTQYLDVIYNMSKENISFTKHALNEILKKIAYNQIFTSTEKVDSKSQEYDFLQKHDIVNRNGEIVYLELAIYFCSLYISNSGQPEYVIRNKIVPEIQKGVALSNNQIEVYVSIWLKCSHSNNFDTILNTLNSVVCCENVSNLEKKIVIKVLHRCIQSNVLFREYLHYININTYSIIMQRSILKVCAELYPEDLLFLEDTIEDSQLSYAIFILTDDYLYRSLRNRFKLQMTESDFVELFRHNNGLIRLWHILTYWGWDNVCNAEYMQLKNIISKVLQITKTDDDTIVYVKNILKNHAYSIFFNADSADFEEQFNHCIHSEIRHLAQDILNQKKLTSHDYQILLEANQDINNSWIFILSNVIVANAMHNHPDETYKMLYHYWDNIECDVPVQHLDFYLSSSFWSLYLSAPCDREKFVALFERLIAKYERTLFLFPKISRSTSIRKFTEEFDKTFEDGFNPIAIYFYTAPYKSLTSPEHYWNDGKEYLKVYWNLSQEMSDCGKYDKMLRIIHALGQMISIYPKEGYSALKNLSNFQEPIIRRGILRIFKENYLRYSKITKVELENPIYHFDSDDIDAIVYNTDFFLENRTLEQLHWSRLFYNLGHFLDINVPELFLSCILNSSSWSNFLQEFVKNLPLKSE